MRDASDVGGAVRPTPAPFLERANAETKPRADLASPSIARFLSDAEMKRLILEIAALEAPPSSRALHLRAKDEFPKLLALDMNIWVALSKAHYGRAERSSHDVALRAIRSATANGKLVAPVFPMNLTEVTDSAPDDRRARLAAFMVELSQNHSIVYSGSVTDREIHDAIQSTYLGHVVRSDIRTLLLAWGMDAAMGIGGVEITTSSGKAMPRQIQQLLDEVRRHPEVSRLALTSVFSQEDTAWCRQLDNNSANMMALVRTGCSGLTSKERIAAETWNLAQRGTVRDAIDRVLAFNSVVPTPFFDWLENETHRVAFFSSIPQLDVQLTLLLARDRNLEAVPDRNDLKDLSFFGLAIPYANFVVAEKHWSHIARASKAAERYGTQVVSLDRLPALLATEGCYEPGGPGTSQGVP